MYARCLITRTSIHLHGSLLSKILLYLDQWRWKEVLSDCHSSECKYLSVSASVCWSHVELVQNLVFEKAGRLPKKPLADLVAYDSAQKLCVLCIVVLIKDREVQSPKDAIRWLKYWGTIFAEYSVPFTWWSHLQCRVWLWLWFLVPSRLRSVLTNCLTTLVLTVHSWHTSKTEGAAEKRGDVFYSLEMWFIHRLGPILTIAVGIVLNFGGYIAIWLAMQGYYTPSYWQLVLLLVVACNGQTWFETAALVTSVRNFETERWANI